MVTNNMVMISDERLRLILQARSWVYRRPKQDLDALRVDEARKWVIEFLEEQKKRQSRANHHAFLCGRNNNEPAIPNSS